MTHRHDEFQRSNTMRRPLHTLVVLSGLLLMFGLANCAGKPPDFGAASGSTLNPVCRDVALDRTSDAKDAGLDDETQQQVLKRAYADCADWHAKWDAQPAENIKQ
jgi:hypothetical protein